MDFLKKFKTLAVPLDTFDCSVEACNYKAASAKELLSHLRTVHSKCNDIRSHCLYSKLCEHTDLFKTYYGLNTHLSKFHPEFFVETADAQESAVVSSGSDKETHLSHDEVSVERDHSNLSQGTFFIIIYSYLHYLQLCYIMFVFRI